MSKANSIAMAPLFKYFLATLWGYKGLFTLPPRKWIRYRSISQLVWQFKWLQWLFNVSISITFYLRLATQRNVKQQQLSAYFLLPKRHFTASHLINGEEDGLIFNRTDKPIPMQR